MAIYYVASSASGQDEPNPALWLVVRAGKIKPSCPLGTTRSIPQEKFPESRIINSLLTKFVRSRWLDIGLVLFCEFVDLDFVSVHKHAKKELGQYPAILTSRLVNNQLQYLLLLLPVGAWGEGIGNRKAESYKDSHFTWTYIQFCTLIVTAGFWVRYFELFPSFFLFALVIFLVRNIIGPFIRKK